MFGSATLSKRDFFDEYYGIVSVACYQDKIFKRFKEKEKFIQMISKVKIHKSTIIFKINIFRLIKKQWLWSFWIIIWRIYSWFSWVFLFLKLSLWCKSLSHKLSIDLQEKLIRKTCLYVIEMCKSHQIIMNMIFMNMYWNKLDL